MSQFLSELISTPVEDGLKIRLRQAFIYRLGPAGDGAWTITVPSGFVSDYASVPRGLWWLFPPHQYPEPPVLHDYLYSHLGYSRAVCDAVFLDALQARQVPRWRRVCMYLAVRFFGWMHRAKRTLEP